MCVVASGVGDVDVSGGSECVDGQVAQGGEVCGGMAGAGLTVVFAEGDVEDVVACLASPVPLFDLGKNLWVGVFAGQAGDGVDELPALPDARVDLDPSVVVIGDLWFRLTGLMARSRLLFSWCRGRDAATAGVYEAIAGGDVLVLLLSGPVGGLSSGRGSRRAGSMR